MRKIFNISKNKKGFTLIELIITVALLTIVMGMVSGVMTFIGRDYYESKEYVEAMEKAKSSARIIAKNLEKAELICLCNYDSKVYDNQKDLVKDLTQSMYQKDGQLYSRKTLNGEGAPVFDKAYWGNYDLDLKFLAYQREVDVSVLEIKIILTTKDKTKSFKYSETVDILNAKQIVFIPDENQATGVGSEFSYAIYNLPAPEDVSDEDYDKQVMK